MPKWNSSNSSCCSCSSGGLGPTGPIGPIGPTGYTGYTGLQGATGYTGLQGATGSSIIYVGGNTGAYNAFDITTISTTETRINEHAFQVTSTNNIFLFHYNIVLDGGGDNRQITSTLGIANTIGATGGNSTNLQTGTTPVTLTGVNTDKYIAGSHNTVNANDAVNLSGHATATNLAAGTWYVTVWVGSNTSSTTLTSPVVHLVVLQIQ